jgi:hypothetical protein
VDKGEKTLFAGTEPSSVTPRNVGTLARIVDQQKNSLVHSKAAVTLILAGNGV